MKPQPRTVFVGQGPNQPVWKKATDFARSTGKTGAAVDMFAVGYCARLAITGQVGIRLAALAGMERLEFLATYSRFNLNSRWNGKKGKGDAFDAKEAQTTAMGLLSSGKFDKFVLLGASVASAFGVHPNIPLSICAVDGRSFLVFPHPSAINTFWNHPEKVWSAQSALRAFLA